MTNDGPEPANAKAVVQAAQDQAEPSPQLHNVNDVNQPHPSIPPDTPTPPPSGAGRTRAPVPVTLLESHQAALRRIHTLEAHNAKLYEDNCRLVNAVNVLNDRLSFFGAPQNTQMLRLADMQEKLRACEAARASISLKYQDLLQCVSAGSPHHHVHAELQAARDAYASLDREYRVLVDKYARLKAFANTSRVAHHQPQPTAPAPHVTRDPMRSEFHSYHDQNQSNSIPSTSVLRPGTFQPLPERDHRRHSLVSVMAQPLLRPGTAPTSTTWSVPLPAPPSSAPLPGGYISPTSLPVHAPVPVGSLPLLHPAQMKPDPRTLPGLPAVTPQHFVDQSTPEQHKATVHFHQHSGEVTDAGDNEPTLCGEQAPAPTPLESSPRPPKRPNDELQTSTSPKGEHKKARTEGEMHHPTATNADTYPEDKIRSPSPSTSSNPPSDQKSSAPDSDGRSYEDCVKLIFEKDADVENGVFCGLCLDRYDAKMIPEPPDVLVEPDFDFLLRHCMTMHPTVWDDLRRKT